MTSTTRQATQDELSLAQEEADSALYTMETVRKRLRVRIDPLKKVSPEHYQRATRITTPLESKADPLTSTWVEASSHDIYRDRDNVLTQHIYDLRDVATQLHSLQSSWEKAESDLAAELEKLEAEIGAARTNAEKNVKATKDALQKLKLEGVISPYSDGLLLEAESFSRSQDTILLLKATHLAQTALSYANNLKELRTTLEKRLASTRTRFDAAHTKATNIRPTLTTLRREHPYAAWEDVEITEATAEQLLASLTPLLEAVSNLLESGKVEEADSSLADFRKRLAEAEEKVTAPTVRLHLLKKLATDKDDILTNARRKVRDAQRLCVSLGTPQSAANELDSLSLQLTQVKEEVDGRYPNYYKMSQEIERIVAQTQQVVGKMRALPNR